MFGCSHVISTIQCAASALWQAKSTLARILINLWTASAGRSSYGNKSQLADSTRSPWRSAELAAGGCSRPIRDTRLFLSRRATFRPKRRPPVRGHLPVVTQAQTEAPLPRAAGRASRLKRLSSSVGTVTTFWLVATHSHPIRCAAFANESATHAYRPLRRDFDSSPGGIRTAKMRNFTKQLHTVRQATVNSAWRDIAGLVLTWAEPSPPIVFPNK